VDAIPDRLFVGALQRTLAYFWIDAGENAEMIRVADFIAETASRFGVTQVFMVTGGGAMHLNDAFSRHPSLQTLCMHHEQACAMAAEGYARIRGKMALLNVTTGPGGLNALNGVFGAYTDSVPMLVISGQVKRET